VYLVIGNVTVLQDSQNVHLIINVFLLKKLLVYVLLSWLLNVISICLINVLMDHVD